MGKRGGIGRRLIGAGLVLALAGCGGGGGGEVSGGVAGSTGGGGTSGSESGGGQAAETDDAPEVDALVGAWFDVLTVYATARDQNRAGSGADGWRDDLRAAAARLRAAGDGMNDETLTQLLSDHLGRMEEILDNEGPAFSILPRIGLSVSQALARHPAGECALGRMRAYDAWDHAVLAAWWRADADRGALEEWEENLEEATARGQDADARSTMATVTAMQVSMACSLLDVRCDGIEEANEELSRATRSSDVERATRNLVRATERALPLLAEQVPGEAEQTAWREAAQLAEEAGEAWRQVADNGLRAAERFQERVELLGNRLAVALDRSMAAGKACGRPHSIEPVEVPEE